MPIRPSVFDRLIRNGQFLALFVLVHFWVLEIVPGDIVLVDIDVIYQEVVAVAVAIIIFDDDSLTVSLGQN